MLALTTIIGSFLLLFHPFYVSITSIDYNEKGRRMEVSCRIFYDDLEDALKSGGRMQVDLINPMDKHVTDSVLADYLQQHFRISVDDKPLSLRYLGYEIEDDVAWCYLEAGNVDEVKRLTVDSRILFDQFPKQSNILHVTVYGKRKSTKLDNPKRRAIFEW